MPSDCLICNKIKEEKDKSEKGNVAIFDFSYLVVSLRKITIIFPEF